MINMLNLYSHKWDKKMSTTSKKSHLYMWMGDIINSMKNQVSNRLKYRKYRYKVGDWDKFGREVRSEDTSYWLETKEKDKLSCKYELFHLNNIVQHRMCNKIYYLNTISMETGMIYIYS